jgi:ribonucleotide monophosphatase NagD (HAD superfamily)
VGDRLDTDIKFGKDGGMTSALVLTGCTTADTLMNLDIGAGTDDEPFPHIVFPHMGMMGVHQ